MKRFIIPILVIIVLAGGFLVVVKSFRKVSQISTNNMNTRVLNTPVTSPTSDVTQPESSGNITLTIQSPVDKSTVSTPNVTVVGTTSPNADVSANEADTTADANGKFTATVALDEGDNLISVVVNDAKGNFIEKDLTVTYTPAQ